MLVRRWQAPVVPMKEQIVKMFEMEDLEPYEEIFPTGSEFKNTKSPFDEVRMVAKGELLLNVAGNQLLLRPGDRIVIPSNTKHSKKVQGESECVCICAKKVF
ncbi:MAG: cupin domain-containing protein [Pseudomonadota bacterium]